MHLSGARAMDRVAFEERLSKARHELRTPLNHIIGYCEILLEDAEDQGAEELLPDLQKVRGAGQELLGLVGQLLAPEHLLGEQVSV